MLTELRHETDAWLRNLHTIRARTSNVLAATDAFSALSEKVAALSRSRIAAPMERHSANVSSSPAFEERLEALLVERDKLQQRFASELTLATPVPPPPKKPWWRCW
jgi:hypothetical protein